MWGGIDQNNVDKYFWRGYFFFSSLLIITGILVIIILMTNSGNYYMSSTNLELSYLDYKKQYDNNIDSINKLNAKLIDPTINSYNKDKYKSDLDSLNKKQEYLKNLVDNGQNDNYKLIQKELNYYYGGLIGGLLIASPFIILLIIMLISRIISKERVSTSQTVADYYSSQQSDFSLPITSQTIEQAKDYSLQQEQKLLNRLPPLVRKQLKEIK